MPTMRVRDLVGATVDYNKIKAWFSNFGFHDSPASFVLAQKAIMDTMTESKSSFTLINEPLPFTVESAVIIIYII